MWNHRPFVIEKKIGHLSSKKRSSLIKVQSGELSDDLLILVVVKSHKGGDVMELTSLNNPVKVHILLALHVV
jgi:hypothetical protein